MVTFFVVVGSFTALVWLVVSSIRDAWRQALSSGDDQPSGRAAEPSGRAAESSGRATQPSDRAAERHRVWPSKHQPSPPDPVGNAGALDTALWTELDDRQLTRLLKEAAS